MEQNVGVVNFSLERFFVCFVDNHDAKPLVLERRNRRAETGRSAILQNGFHAGFVPLTGAQEVTLLASC